MSTKLETIPLCQLKPSKSNMRKTDKHADIPQLAASIEANGLLENLVVHPTKGESFEVVAGGRRLAAFKLLAKSGKIEQNHPVACLILNDTPAAALTEISLTENFERVPPHPADQFDAFAKLVQGGFVPETIAARFGVTLLFVEQRLKLSKVSPKLVAQYREGAMTLEQLTAFAISGDRKLQEQVWFESPYNDLSAQHIRRLLTQSHVSASDPRAMFVGVNAYEAAGGAILRDLFDQDGDGLLTNSQLLDRLVEEKFRQAVETLKGEGWSWVEAQAEFGWSARFQRMSPSEQMLAEAEENRLSELSDRYDALISALEEEEDEAASSALDKVAEELEALQLRKQLWTDEQKKAGGVGLSLDHHGGLLIEHGLVRRESAAPATANPGAETGKPARRGYSDAVLLDLSAHRTAILREVLASRPDAALLAVLHSLATATFYHGETSCLDIGWHSAELERASETVGKSKAAKALALRQKAWKERLPEEKDGLWDWLQTLGDPDRLELLAFCIALSANVLHRSAQYESRTEDASRLAAFTGLDMADWWIPTASFFERLQKADILNAVSEALSPEAATRISDLKKSHMAKRAEKLLKNSTWLPPSLRTDNAATSGT